MNKIALLCVSFLVACGSGAPAGETDSTQVSTPTFEPPVLTNPDAPVSYPPDLFRQGVEASVTLRLYITAGGTIISDSTRIAESSGYAAFDSAAVAGAASMDFAPARRKGKPVATLFLQPIHFKLPTRPASGEQS